VTDAEAGGTKEIRLPPEQGASRVLSDAELTNLINLGRRVEAFFKSPRDIEWCIADGKVYLLQSRPITTL